MSWSVTSHYLRAERQWPVKRLPRADQRLGVDHTGIRSSNHDHPLDGFSKSCGQRERIIYEGAQSCVESITIDCYVEALRCGTTSHIRPLILPPEGRPIFFYIEKDSFSCLSITCCGRLFWRVPTNMPASDQQNCRAWSLHLSPLPSYADLRAPAVPYGVYSVGVVSAHDIP